MPDARPMRTPSDIRKERAALLRRLAELSTEAKAIERAMLADYDGGMERGDICERWRVKPKMLDGLLRRNERSDKKRRLGSMSPPQLADYRRLVGMGLTQKVARQIAMEVR